MAFWETKKGLKESLNLLREDDFFRILINSFMDWYLLPGYFKARLQPQVNLDSELYNFRTFSAAWLSEMMLIFVRLMNHSRHSWEHVPIISISPSVFLPHMNDNGHQFTNWSRTVIFLLLDNFLGILVGYSTVYYLFIT